MPTNEIVARLASGAEVGFRDAATARRLHPDAEIVRYQDGRPYDAGSGDTPALSVILNPMGGRSAWHPAPEFSPPMHYVHSGQHRPIKVYETIDVRFILEDFYAKLASFHRGVQELANFG